MSSSAASSLSAHTICSFGLFTLLQWLLYIQCVHSCKKTSLHSTIGRNMVTAECEGKDQRCSTSSTTSNPALPFFQLIFQLLRHFDKALCFVDLFSEPTVCKQLHLCMKQTERICRWNTMWYKKVVPIRSPVQHCLPFPFYGAKADVNL